MSNLQFDARQLPDDVLQNLLPTNGQEGQVLIWNSQLGKAVWTTLDIPTPQVDELLIGTPVFLTSTVVPDNVMLADGSLALFEDFPRFHQKYLDGGFEGNILPAEAREEDLAEYPGKFVEDENGLGLYLPRLNGLFPRFSTNVSNISKRIYAEAPNIKGSIEAPNVVEPVIFVNEPIVTGAFEVSPAVNFTAHDSSTYSGPGHKNMSFDASRSSDVYSDDATTLTPDGFDCLVGVYLC